jgi:hypothetical protein
MAAGSVEGERPAGLPESWVVCAPDAEIMPTFVYDPQGGLKENGSLRIRTNGGIEQHGWFQRSYPVTGGKWYRFQAMRKTDQVTLRFALRGAMRIIGRSWPTRLAGGKRARVSPPWPSPSIQPMTHPTPQDGPASAAFTTHRPRRLRP